MSEGVLCCDLCSQPIRGEYQRVPQFSASGARPDSSWHKQGDPECRPRRAPGLLGRPRGG